MTDILDRLLNKNDIDSVDAYEEIKKLRAIVDRFPVYEDTKEPMIPGDECFIINPRIPIDYDYESDDFEWEYILEEGCRIVCGAGLYDGVIDNSTDSDYEPKVYKNKEAAENKIKELNNDSGRIKEDS